MTPGATVEIDTAKDIKALSAALKDATAVVVRCPAEHFKAVAAAITKGVHATLVDLELIISDFDPAEEVGKSTLTAKASTALWAALPSLKRLRLRGHALCSGLDHDGLERLEVEGYAFGAGAVPPAGTCPRLHTLRWAFSGDLHGVALEPLAIERLWTQRLPALEHLDLFAADLDGSLLSVGSFLKAPLLKQLKTLGLPSSSTESWGKVLTALPRLTSLVVQDPALAGLDKRIVVVEPANDDEPQSDDGEARLELDFVTDQGLAKAKLLARTQPLREVILFAHNLRAEGARLMGQVVAAHAALQTLDLNKPNGSGWDAKALEAFVDGIDGHHGLTALRLRDNNLQGAGKTLAVLLGKLPRLETLELSQTDLDADDLGEVLTAIPRLKNLRVLLMGGLDDTEASAKVWNKLSSSSLQTLQLWTTAFKAHWPLVFHELGKRLPALHTLGLDGGPLSTEATKALVDGLGEHRQLRSLRLDLAPTTLAYKALGSWLSSSSLTHLTLEEAKNAVGPGERCDSSAIGALANAKALTHLTIEIDRADTAKHQALAQAVTKMPTMQALAGWFPDEEDARILRGLEDLLAASSVRTYKYLDAVTLGALLERNAIETLWIAGGYGINEKLSEQAAELKATTALRTLVLVGGELKTDAAKVLVSVLTNNTSVRFLTVSMALKASVGKDLVKRLSTLGRFETITFGVGPWMTAADQKAIAASAKKGGPRVLFVDALVDETD